MAWTIEYLDSAKRVLRKADKQVARRIVNFMNERVASLDDPRQIGKRLTGPLEKFWSYRVGDHRVLCEFVNEKLVVLVVEIGHRGDVYR